MPIVWNWQRREQGELSVGFCDRWGHLCHRAAAHRLYQPDPGADSHRLCGRRGDPQRRGGCTSRWWTWPGPGPACRFWGLDICWPRGYSRQWTSAGCPVSLPGGSPLRRAALPPVCYLHCWRRWWAKAGTRTEIQMKMPVGFPRRALFMRSITEQQPCWRA